MTPANVTNARRLEGSVAVVTGAGKGIGRAVARRLAVEGAVVVADDISADAVEETVQAIRDDGGEAAAVVADVSSAEDVDRLFSAAEEFGSVAVLVNNAGLIGQTRHFLDADEAWWDRLIGTNLKSVFLCSHRAASAMVQTGGGAIVSTSSGGATKAHRGEAAYDASKGGIEALTRAMALDLAPYGIRVNAVAPGSIDVSAGQTPREVLAERGETIPLRRVGVPDDLVGTYAHLVSDDARYVTGVVIAVDGGMVAQQRSPQVDVFGLDKFPNLPSAPSSA